MSSDTSRLLLSLLIVVVDAVLLQAAYGLSFLIRYGGHPPTYNLIAYTSNLLLLTIIGPLTFYFCGLYGIRRRTWSSDAERIIKGILLFSLLVMASSFMIRAFSFPRTVFILAIPLQLVLMLAWRRYVWLKLSVPRKNRMVVVGTVPEIVEVYAKSSCNQMDGYEIDACILVNQDNTYQRDKRANTPVEVIGYITDPDIADVLATYDGAILCTSIEPSFKHKIALDLIEADKAVLVVPTLYEAILSSTSLTAFSDLPLISFHDSETVVARASVKRIIDLVLSSIALVLGAPLMLLVAVGIKLTSPKGPVLYRQERVGYGNRTFNLYKFRTMIPDAEKLSGPVFATEHDPRITPFGRFLRAARLDELPQFLNIFLGDMSIVGPRPERPHFVNKFLTEVPEYNLRHKVPVGLTGLAQVMGNYDTEMKNKLRYDLAYVGSWTLANDFLIMIKTAGVMVTKGKAR